MMPFDFGLSFYVLAPLLFALLLIHTTEGSSDIRYAESCPRNGKAWNDSERGFGCNPDRKPVYHCIMSLNESLIEVCMQIQTIDEGKWNTWKMYNYIHVCLNQTNNLMSNISHPSPTANKARHCSNEEVGLQNQKDII